MVLGMDTIVAVPNKISILALSREKYICSVSLVLHIIVLRWRLEGLFRNVQVGIQFCSELWIRLLA